MIILHLARLLRKLRTRKRVGLAFVATLMAVALLGNAACFYVFDGAADETITFGDALWYSIISITTIGYGDYSAASTGARIGTVVFIVVLGLSTFSVFLGMLIDWTTTVVTLAHKGLGKAMAKDHILIVHFPSERRVKQLIDEIRSDAEHRSREIVLVNDQIEELPFAVDNVLFIRGSTLDEETYHRASTDAAELAIVLSYDYADPNSDAVVAASASVIDSIKPEIHLVAECLDERHRSLFRSVRCDAIVSGMEIGGNLLVQESHDPGIAQMVEIITSNRVGPTLYSTEVTSAMDADYATLAKKLLDDNVNVLAVNRGTDSHTSIAGLAPRSGDLVIYVGDRRLCWPDLLSMAGMS